MFCSGASNYKINIVNYFKKGRGVVFFVRPRLLNAISNTFDAKNSIKFVGFSFNLHLKGLFVCIFFFGRRYHT